MSGGVRTCALAAAILLLSTMPASAQRAWLLVDADSGEVLQAEKATARHFPASLTKMMTVYLALEAVESGKINFSDWLKVSRKAASQGGVKLGLRTGKTIGLKDAILAVIVRSSNDMAVAVAEKLAGSEKKFAARMSAKAKQLGMSRTVFRNASGLPNAEQWTTAKDMAILARALMRDFPQHFHIFSQQTLRFGGKRLRGYNDILSSYQGADGIKTGFICASGYNLVASARRPGQRLIGVVLGSPSRGVRRSKMTKLLNAGFARKADFSKPRRYLKDLIPSKADDAPRWLGAAIDACNGKGRGKGRGKPRRLRLKFVAGWALDIGIYVKEDAAKSAAIEAAAQLREALDGGSPTVIPKAVGGLVKYLAVISGLEQENAIKVCLGLRDKKDWCLVMPPAGVEAKLEDAERMAKAAREQG